MLSNFFSENRTVYEKISKSLVEPERPQIAIWRRVAFYISKATRVRVHAFASALTRTHTHVLAHTQKHARPIAFSR